MGICGSTNKIESTIDVAYQTTNTVPLVQDVSANSVSANSVSANDVSANSVSANSVSANIIPITSLVIPVTVNADPDPK